MVQPLPSLEKSANTINETLLEGLTQTECVALSNLHCGESPSRRTVPLKIDKVGGGRNYKEFCTFRRQVAEYRYGQRKTRLSVSILLAYYGKDDYPIIKMREIKNRPI
jgi:hypothetical protein